MPNSEMHERNQTDVFLRSLAFTDETPFHSVASPTCAFACKLIKHLAKPSRVIHPNLTRRERGHDMPQSLWT